MVRHVPPVLAFEPGFDDPLARGVGVFLSLEKRSFLGAVYVVPL